MDRSQTERVVGNRGIDRAAPLSHGTGATLIDVNGRALLDLTASFGTCSLGYGHPDLVSALQAQVASLTQAMADIWPHESLGKAAEAVKRVAGRSEHAEVFFTTSGSEAIELAWKLARLHTGKPGLLCFSGGFHGQTGVAMGATSFRSLRDAFYLGQPPVTHVPFPLSRVTQREGAGEHLTIDSIVELVRSGFEYDGSGFGQIGAVLIEPIQNFAGYRIPAEGLLCALREICDEFGMLLIVDEVFTGFGRAGAWLASDVEDCRPDIVCVGKGMLGGIGGGACVAPKELMEKLSGAGMVQLHGSTFKANPIACTAIATTVAVMERDKLIVRSARLGEIALSQLERLHDLPIVAEVRGRGLVIGIELCSPSDSTSARDLAQRACAAAETHGINIICNGYPDGNVVAISPPLVIKEDDFLGALNIVVSVLEGLANGC